jgi:hypothetical protein
MRSRSRRIWSAGVLALALACHALAGCGVTPSAHTVSRNYSTGEAPIDPPKDCDDDCFENSVGGGRLFGMYCGSCHNARALGERPFANYEVAVAHMREQAYLTGKEYRQIIHFLRRWHDVGPATADLEPSPKRFFFSQPISELRQAAPAK